MSRRGDPLALDEAILNKTYGLSTASPARWESGQAVDDYGAATSAGGGRADEPDPLGLHRGGILAANADLAPEARARILLHSKAFDPKTFLATVHPTATFKNLSDGHERLEIALKQRSEALKVLVEEEFDRFASVKGTTMGVFDEMKMGPLADGGDYGVKALKESLAVASSKAEQVYHPILDARLKADRLRSTLGVFERNKFFFNLPGTLMEAIEAGRPDVALSAYKKGRYVSEYGAAQLLGRTAAATITPLQEEQARRIIDKVWSEVERIIGELRGSLARRLKDPRAAIEDVEKTMDILVQLKPTEDPLWLFFDTRHQHILQTMRATYQSALARFRCAFEAAASLL